MCLFPRLIQNPKYKPNKKNNKNPPVIKDWRVKFVPIGCGNCLQCRKQKSNAWKIRLTEELKVNKYGYFITFTFRDEELNRISTEIKSKDVNDIATYAVRHFLERWRKTKKKSLKHFFITELGTQKTERIHIHGIIFANDKITKKELENHWKYGFIDVGNYCNIKSINYIVKYITKIDIKHKQYKPKILCSPGLGKNYVSENQIAIHKYKADKTAETYVLPSGRLVNLPIYYRNKFFSEEERENLWIFRLDKGIRYIKGEELNINSNDGLQRYLKLLSVAQSENYALGFGDGSEKWNKKSYELQLKNINKIT